jgi:hypothetical protein
MNVYLHNVPGRLRVKIPSIKHLNRKARKVESLFVFREGIERVRANAVTGSLKINYDPELVSVDQLLAVLREHGHLETITTWSTRPVIISPPHGLSRRSARP